MWFDYARIEGFPTQFGMQRSPVSVDVLECGFIAAFIILMISFIIVIPTSKVPMTVFRIIRITVLLVIGLLIMLGNFGQEWEVGRIRTKTPYKAGTPVEINASIDLKIGLRGINITLKTEEVPKEFRNEVINYNERFSWTWDQGRFGFGPFAGHLQQEFRAAQRRGVPIPILWIVDYFVIDGEGFRSGRFYRTAGWYSHILLYSAFASWLLSMILFRSVIIYAAYCLGLCGLLQLLANLLWFVIRNPLDLKIPFENATLTTKFGPTFWLTFYSGTICVIVAIIVIIMDLKFHTSLHTFFGVDPLNSYDEVAYLTKSEELQLRQKKIKDVSLVEMGKSTQEDEDVDYTPVYIKRKTRAFGPPVIRSNKPKHITNA